MLKIIISIFILISFKAKAMELTLGANQKLVEQRAAHLILQKIVDPIGIKLNIIPLPAARSQKHNLDLKTSGELARITEYGSNKPTLTRVEPSYYSLKSAAFCRKDKKMKIKSYKELNQYTVSKIRGVAHSDEATKSHKNTINMQSALQAFNHLKLRRSDVVIDTEINGKRILKDQNYNKEIEHCGDLKDYQLYLYLNEKHSHLSEKISIQIQKIIKNKELDAIIKEAETQALKLPLMK